MPTVTTYAEALSCLRADGFEVGPCPALCRRKGEHAHMAHGAGTAQLHRVPGGE